MHLKSSDAGDIPVTDVRVERGRFIKRPLREHNLRRLRAEWYSELDRSLMCNTQGFGAGHIGIMGWHMTWQSDTRARCTGYIGRPGTWGQFTNREDTLDTSQLERSALNKGVLRKVCCRNTDACKEWQRIDKNTGWCIHMQSTAWIYAWYVGAETMCRAEFRVSDLRMPMPVRDRLRS